MPIRGWTAACKLEQQRVRPCPVSTRTACDYGMAAGVREHVTVFEGAGNPTAGPVSRTMPEVYHYCCYINLAMLFVLLYMLPIYDRVLTSGGIDILTMLTVSCVGLLLDSTGGKAQRAFVWVTPDLLREHFGVDAPRK